MPSPGRYPANVASVVVGAGRRSGEAYRSTGIRTYLLTDHGVRLSTAERGTFQAGVNAPVGARAILPSEPVN